MVIKHEYSHHFPELHLRLTDLFGKLSSNKSLNRNPNKPQQHSHAPTRTAQVRGRESE